MGCVSVTSSEQRHREEDFRTLQALKKKNKQFSLSRGSVSQSRSRRDASVTEIGNTANGTTQNI